MLMKQGLVHSGMPGARVVLIAVLVIITEHASLAMSNTRSVTIPSVLFIRIGPTVQYHMDVRTQTQRVLQTVPIHKRERYVPTVLLKTENVMLRRRFLAGARGARVVRRVEPERSGGNGTVLFILLPSMMVAMSLPTIHRCIRGIA